MSRIESESISEQEQSAVKVTAIELTEKDVEKNRFSRILLSFDSWMTRTGAMVSRVTYTRRYDLNAEFDSVSNYFQIPDHVVSGCRDLIREKKLLENYPPKKVRNRPATYSEIRVFSGNKVVARVLKRGPLPASGEGCGDDEIFDRLSALLKRTLG